MTANSSKQKSGRSSEVKQDEELTKLTAILAGILAITPGGDASAANQTTEIARLNSILAKLVEQDIIHNDLYDSAGFRPWLETISIATNSSSFKLGEIDTYQANQNNRPQLQRLTTVNFSNATLAGLQAAIAAYFAAGGYQNVFISGNMVYDGANYVYLMVQGGQ